MSIGKLFNKFRARITKEKALEIAKGECSERGWTWLEPVHVSSRVMSWKVRTNADSRGVSAQLDIDKRTGKVKRAIFWPR
jgi:hypothetical protein